MHTHTHNGKKTTCCINEAMRKKTEINTEFKEYFEEFIMVLKECS